MGFNVGWGEFEAQLDQKHQSTMERLYAAMETGHHGAAREILDEYAKEYPAQAEALRLSLVRKFGTGL